MISEKKNTKNKKQGKYERAKQPVSHWSTQRKTGSSHNKRGQTLICPWGDSIMF